MRKKGFTLVELLIVIGVISALMLLGATNWIAQQQKARDARRKADLTQIQAALEMYRSSPGITGYPDDGANPSDDYIEMESELTTGANIVIDEIPTDPKDGSEYFYDSDGDTYTLKALATQMEREGEYTVKNP